jgi:tetratricopeptide (TPR) repeat protein
MNTLEFAVDRLRATGVNIVLPAAASMLGLTYSIAGRDVDAIPLLEEAVACSRWSWIHSQPLVCLGEGYLLAGRRDAAESQAVQALAVARARGERGIEAWALRLLGETAAQSDAAQPRADDHYREALGVATELGMRPLIAHCHLGLGKLCHRTDKREQAREHLTTATTMYREMGMTYWLETRRASFSTQSTQSPSSPPRSS